MSNPPPVVYLLHGEDAFGISQFISMMEKKLGDPANAEMNITKLDAVRSPIKDIQAAAAAMPFLSDRRLVILSKVTIAFKKKADQEKLLTLFENLPTTTALVVNVEKELTSKNWLMKWARNAKQSAYIQNFPALKGGALSARLRKHASDSGGELTPQAAAYLAELAGDNLLAGIFEVDKLLNYVDFQRPVEVDDVENLWAFEQAKGDFFGLIDALGTGNGRKAIDMLQGLLEESDPLQLFFSLVGNYRILIQTREIIDQGGDESKVAELLSIHPYRAKKLSMHARKISLASLENIYYLLHDYDLQIKTGRCQPKLALDLFIAKLTVSTT